jgi:hypothetical protein
MSERTAIVTLAIGDDFAERWHQVCEANWRAYADRHGYDVICIENPLDDSQRAQDRSPSWQKLLVPGQPFASDYDRLVWVDADVVFGEKAPAITDGVPIDRVGAVDERVGLTADLEWIVYHGPAEVYYRDFGLPHEFDQIVQAGVMVLSPEHHRELFQHVYDAYEDQEGLFYEMRPLSWELLNADLVTWLDPRFNELWFAYRAAHKRVLAGYGLHPHATELAAEALKTTYFVHFAGEGDLMPFTLGERRPPAPRRPEPVPPTQTPVALFLNRGPETTLRALDAVRQARPGRLLAIANAPRPDVEGEAELCEKTRALLDTIDWPCEVSTNFAAEHLAQTERIESGIDWAFEQAEEVILLEDDCVAHPSFFRYCDELLERYRAREEVMWISGTNFQFDAPASDDSYYFSNYPQSWGWASWRRAWQHYDGALTAWPELRDRGWLEERIDDPSSVAYWSYVFETHHDANDAWDLAWLFSCWVRQGLGATPNVNLISNVGFRDDAAHARPELRGLFADLPTEPMEFPLRHPDELRPNEAADRYTDRLKYGGNISQMFAHLRRIRRFARPVGTAA